MTFDDFAAAHGLLIRHVDYGRWCRTATTDKPRNKNGAYKHLGDVAFVQNHATMTEPSVWFPEKDSEIRIDHAAIARMRAQADKNLQDNRKSAALKAQAIIKQSRYEQHAYLDWKGFPKESGLVYYPDETTNLLVIPMRVKGSVVGCQLINRDGDKKFLFGQRCAGAEFLIDGNGVDVWCEGYATGLSIKAAMGALKARCRIHICFSAGNMEAMAKAAGKGFVVADNDISGTGERAAKATGLPYFMPPDAGSDFNDHQKVAGLFLSSQALRRFMQQWSSAPSQGVAREYPARG